MKKIIIIATLLFLFGGSLWGQLNIVGVNAEKPQTKNNYFERPVIVEKYIRKYYEKVNPYDNPDHLFDCFPEGQRFFYYGGDDGYCMDADTLQGLPQGYYNYVGVLVCREQAAPIVEKQKNLERFYKDLKTISSLKEKIILEDNYRIWPFWKIIEDDSGKKYCIPYSYDSYRERHLLVMEYYNEISRVLKDKEVALINNAILERGRSKVFEEDFFFDYWTKTPIPCKIFNLAQAREHGHEIQYYHVNDIVVDVEKGIQIIAVICDPYGNIFSVPIPLSGAIVDMYSGGIAVKTGKDYHSGRLFYPKDDFLNYISMTKQTEQERKDRENLEKQQKAKAEQARRTAIIQKYGEKMGNLILQQKIALGMTTEMVRESIGHPSRSYKNTTAQGTTTVLEYAYLVLTFENDNLVSVTEVE